MAVPAWIRLRPSSPEFVSMLRMGELYLQFEYELAALQLTLAMLGMGATLTAGDFVRLARNPGEVVKGTVIQVVLPALTLLLFSQLVNLEIGLFVGLAIVVAIPGGTISNIFTYLSRGNVPLSITITGITTLLCLASTPLIIELLAGEQMQGGFEMPIARIVMDICFFLLLPLACGILINRHRPNFSPLVTKVGIRGSVVVLVLMLIGASFAGRIDQDVLGDSGLVLVVAFFCLLNLLGGLLPRGIGFGRESRIALEMEIMVRNINLGVMIAATLIARGAPWAEMTIMTVFVYGGVQVATAALLTTWRHFRGRG